MAERITTLDILSAIEELNNGPVAITSISQHIGMPRERLSSFLRVLQMFGHIHIVDNEFIILTTKRQE